MRNYLTKLLLGISILSQPTLMVSALPTSLSAMEEDERNGSPKNQQSNFSTFKFKLIETAKHGLIHITPFEGTDEDIRAFTEAVSHPEVMRNMKHGIPWTQIPGLIDKATSSAKLGWQLFFREGCKYDPATTALAWIARDATGKTVGRLGICPYANNEGKPTTGFYLGLLPEFQHKGVGTEIYGLLPELCNRLNAQPSLLLHINSTNHVASQLAQKLGFIEEDISSEEQNIKIFRKDKESQDK